MVSPLRTSRARRLRLPSGWPPSPAQSGPSGKANETTGRRWPSVLQRRRSKHSRKAKRDGQPGAGRLVEEVPCIGEGCRGGIRNLDRFDRGFTPIVHFNERVDSGGNHRGHLTAAMGGFLPVRFRAEPPRYRSCGSRPRLAEERTRYAGLVLRDELYPAPEPSTDEARKVGALPQTPPGAEPLDLHTCARFR